MAEKLCESVTNIEIDLQDIIQLMMEETTWEKEWLWQRQKETGVQTREHIRLIRYTRGKYWKQLSAEQQSLSTVDVETLLQATDKELEGHSVLV